MGERLDLAMLRALDPPVARRVIRRWWRRAGSGRRLALTHVDAALALAMRPEGGGRVRAPGGWIVRGGATLAFDAGDAAEAEPYERELGRGATVDVPGGWCLSLVEAAADVLAPAGDVAPSAECCVLDADALPATLVVRNRRAGDRIRLLGLGGSTSLKRLFIARRVPRGTRATHPIVVADGEIVWVPRCGRGERALVGADTRRVLVLRVEAAPDAAQTR
jgi:tRNA(Ile)-lysidine synthetase-like protein